MTDKQIATETIGRLPNRASLQKIAEELQVVDAIRQGQDAAAAGRVLPHEEVERRFATWVERWTTKAVPRVTATKSLYTFLVFGSLASAMLWMPFGMGYYGVPWNQAGWRILLYIFVFGLPVSALAGCLVAFRGGLSWWRLLLSLAALLVGLVGVFVMRDWLDRFHAL